MYISFSYKLSKLLNNSHLLDEKVHYRFPLCWFQYKAKGLICWKARRTKAISYTKKYNIPLIQLEDAFIGYIENSKCEMINIGYYFDQKGRAYYTAKEDSIILRTITKKLVTKEDLKTAKILMAKVTEHKISKYNFLKSDPFTPAEEAAPILLIDQVFGDASLTSNNHGKQEFEAMYDKAISMAKGKKIYIKTHPMGHGYLEKIQQEGQVILIQGTQNIFDILEHITDVFTVSSQTGFESLLAGKKVHVFGSPFYAGYGLTEDHTKLSRPKATLAELFYAAYIKACKYHIAGVKCSLEEIIDVIITHRKLVNEDNKYNRFFLFNIPRWKIPSIRSFIFHIDNKKKNKFLSVKSTEPEQTRLIRIASKKELMSHKPTSDDAVIVWGFKGEQDDLKNYTENHKIKMITFEDGFIRSVGLGSDFVAPYSFVLDEEGIYYNPQHKSKLETLLSEYKPKKEDLKKAEDLLTKIQEQKITKYNISTNPDRTLIKKIKQAAKNKKIILIPGQVSDDMSLIKGGIMIGSYRDLVPKIRKENPNAYIIYKHHPDVIAGNRKGYISSHILKQDVDLILKEASIVDLIQTADEVHTITSIAGFEALLYGKKTFHYGMPFYGCYGFTEDKSNVETSRKKTDFFAFCYVLFYLYPRYTKLNLAISLTPEITIKLIGQDRTNISSQKRQNYCIRKAKQGLRFLWLWGQKN